MVLLWSIPCCVPSSSVKTLLLERAVVRSSETGLEKPVGAVKGAHIPYL